MQQVMGIKIHIKLGTTFLGTRCTESPRCCNSSVPSGCDAARGPHEHWQSSAVDHGKWGWLNNETDSRQPLVIDLILPIKTHAKHVIYLTYLKSYEGMGYMFTHKCSRHMFLTAFYCILLQKISGASTMP